MRITCWREYKLYIYKLDIFSSSWTKSRVKKTKANRANTKMYCQYKTLFLLNLFHTNESFPILNKNLNFSYYWIDFTISIPDQFLFTLYFMIMLNWILCKVSVSFVGANSFALLFLHSLLTQLKIAFPQMISKIKSKTTQLLFENRKNKNWAYWDLMKLKMQVAKERKYGRESRENKFSAVYRTAHTLDYWFDFSYCEMMEASIWDCFFCADIGIALIVRNTWQSQRRTNYTIKTATIVTIEKAIAGKRTANYEGNKKAKKPTERVSKIQIDQQQQIYKKN